MNDVFVIAEAGVNHNGSVDLALELVDVAAASGADAVKFQTFRADSLATRAAPKAAYQQRNLGGSGDQHSMLKKLELDAAAHARLSQRCREKRIEFMSTPFDVESVALLESVGVARYKVASGEINNPILIRAVASTQKPMILSTGMSTLTDVEFALRVVTSVINGNLLDRVSLLHCTTEYPAPASSANLRAMTTLATAFRVRVGYSDHTEGMEISCAAVALGATIIEKHFTLARNMEGPDHKASLEPNELARFVRALRTVSDALGDGRKVPTAAEAPNIPIARRSVVAARAIRKGEPLTNENITLKRPAKGIPASRYDELIGRIADRDYAADDFIER
jgi:N-acetylneuraminate synthase